ncbi:hypothetical protein [Streptomyces anthocyanicus]|uniref:hypothetical protein n=1 Tax=Streptomyces anthocyanicus TaxID=68174 RepID=UPI003644C511
MSDEAWTCAFTPDGWFRLRAEPHPLTVYVQVRRDESNPQSLYAVHKVFIESQAPISTHTLRDVPFQWVEQIANSLGAADAITSREDPKLLDLETLFEGRAVEVPGVLLDDDKPEKPPALVRPSGRITTDFLRALAETYRYLVATGNTAPSATIAEQVETPLPTVRRWIGQARKAGFLPPGRPGRAG